jgi:hypothetical protein
LPEHTIESTRQAPATIDLMHPLLRLKRKNDYVLYYLVRWFSPLKEHQARIMEVYVQISGYIRVKDNKFPQKIKGFPRGKRGVLNQADFLEFFNRNNLYLRKVNCF